MRDGAWSVIFITEGETDLFGNLVGNIFNLRRRRNRHKRIALSERNIYNPKLRTNENTEFSMVEKDLRYFKGPYKFKDRWLELKS